MAGKRIPGEPVSKSLGAAVASRFCWLIPFAVVMLVMAGCGSTGKQAAPSSGVRDLTTREARLARVPVIDLAVARRPQSTPIPRSFFGLSTEYWTLPVDGRHIGLYGRVISLLHVPEDGPFVLRVGGDSSDHTFHAPDVKRVPPWAFDLTPGFIARTVSVVRERHLRVILDLNLVTAVRKLLIAGVEEAQKVMPRGSIMGYEIGNEPDLSAVVAHEYRSVAVGAKTYAAEPDRHHRPWVECRHQSPRGRALAAAPRGD
jgi:hypothetical protein